MKGATRRGGRLQDVRQVSIHAPTRGATPDSCHKHVTFEFQSTRPQGARPHVAQLTSLAHGFNPRARKGRDHNRYAWFHRQPGFNPRARKGRDRENVSHRSPRRSFNPRARKGRDQSEFTNATGLFVFQSTRPQGARRLSLATFTPGAMFQSTRPQGARLPRPPKIDGNSLVSIHAPARGATYPDYRR